MATVALSSSKGRWVMSAAILASSMAFIDGTALNVVLPALQQGLQATSADLFWVLNAYLLMLASLMLIGGSLGDKLGRKKIFSLGILIFILGSGLCGISNTIFLLVIFRLIQGIGGAFMIPGSLSLISSSINEKERGKAIGTWSAITTAVTIGGPILGGALADAGLWRYIFFINVPIGLAALIILWKKVDEIKDEANRGAIDFGGVITLAFGLALLTFGCLRGPGSGFTDWLVIASLVCGILFLIAFIWIESKSKNPMMPLSLFSNKTFSGVNLLTFFLYAGMGAGMLFLSLNLVQIQGYSQLQSGLVFLPFTLLMILFARFAGNLADKYGPKIFLIAGPSLAGLGMLLLGFVKQTAGAGDYWTTFFPGILVFGIGMSFTVAPLTATVMGSLSDRFSGTASGINNAVTRTSNVFANAVFGALAVLFFSGALQKTFVNSTLNNSEKEEVLTQAIDLGNAKVPASITGQHKVLIEQYFHEGFITVYGNIMFISAILCFLGALMSVLFIKNNAVKTKPN